MSDTPADPFAIQLGDIVRWGSRIRRYIVVDAIPGDTLCIIATRDEGFRPVELLAPVAELRVVVRMRRVG